jgi:hypothetical protein
MSLAFTECGVAQSLRYVDPQSSWVGMTAVAFRVTTVAFRMTTLESLRMTTLHYVMPDPDRVSR